MTDAIRILTVEGDTEFSERTAEFLADRFDNLEYVRAGTASDALDQLVTSEFDCIVSQYQLPGMDGLDFLRRVREEFPGLPFIFVTSKEATVSDAIVAGATDYFQTRTDTDQYELLANRVANTVTATLARQRARERTAEYRTLVNEAPVPMAVVNGEYEFRYVNSYAVETLAADSANDLVGRSVEEFISEDELRATQERLDTALNDRESVDVVEYEFVDCEGNTRVGRGTIIPVTFDGESAAQLVVSDITQQRRTQSRLQRQREQIAQLHEVGVELAGCETTRGVYELMVQAAEQIIDLDLCIADSVSDGYLRVEATSSGLTEYEEAPVEDAGLAGRAHLTGKSFLIDDSDEHPDADPVGEYQSTITVPIGAFGVFQAAAYEKAAFDDQDLELVEILVGHVREALTRIEQEEQLREQRDRLRRENERLDEFTSIVSHDLRNPLNVADLRLDLAMNECDSEHLDAVAHSIERMETLTDELLALARVGNKVMHLEPVTLDRVTTRCWQNVETDDAALSETSAMTLQADASQLQQLLENLFRNAVEHGGDDVTVTVGLLDDRNGFYVEDDGSGMPRDVREQALESGFTTDEEGTGFGLAIVKRVAREHGWSVDVTESSAGGARFEFTGVDIVD